MNINIESLQQVFDLCVVPLLAVLTGYAVSLIKKKTLEINNKTNDQNVQKYVNMLSDTIQECVIATNQTYVNALKGKNAFDKEAQKEAFNQTYEKVMSVITDDAKECLSAAYGDLTLYITTKIEAEVNLNREQ